MLSRKPRRQVFSWTFLFQIRVILPTAYQPAGTATSYPIELKGIELEGTQDRIGVRVNSIKTGGYTDSYVAYPDEVLGKVGSNNLYRLPTMPVTGGIRFYNGKVCYQLTGSSDFNVNSLLPVNFLFLF